MPCVLLVDLVWGYLLLFAACLYDAWSMKSKEGGAVIARRSTPSPSSRLVRPQSVGGINILSRVVYRKDHQISSTLMTSAFNLFDDRAHSTCQKD